MLEELKKKCNLHMAKCCGTCYHFETYDEDFGVNCQQYCECPENEDKSEKDGEEVYFEVSLFDVCDHWRGKASNENLVRELVRIDAEPRYPEDAEVNGVREVNENPKMPLLVHDEKYADGWCWKLDIDIKTGEIVGWPKDVKARAWYKVCDCCRVTYRDKESYDYVPDFLSIDSKGYGDYVYITIDDGKIKNWNETACRDFIENIGKEFQ